MKFYKPQLILRRQINPLGKDQFILHSITLCRKTHFKASGYHVHQSPGQDNSVVVDLFIRYDANIPSLEYITPIVHTIALGELPTEDGEGKIEANVKIQHGEVNILNDRTEDPPASSQGEKGTVSSTDADDETRPDWPNFL